MAYTILSESYGRTLPKITAEATSTADLVSIGTDYAEGSTCTIGDKEYRLDELKGWVIPGSDSGGGGGGGDAVPVVTANLIFPETEGGDYSIDMSYEDMVAVFEAGGLVAIYAYEVCALAGYNGDSIAAFPSMYDPNTSVLHILNIVITSDGVDVVEDAVPLSGGGGGGNLFVNITRDDDVLIADKTYNEIVSAIESGVTVTVAFADDGRGSQYYTLSHIDTLDKAVTFTFIDSNYGASLITNEVIIADGPNVYHNQYVWNIAADDDPK